MTKQKTTEIAKIENSNAVDISAFGSMSVADITPSSIVLIQGDNPLKDSLGVKNGDFVADNMNFGTEFEFMPISSESLLDVFKSNPDVEGGAPKEDYIKTIKETVTIQSDDGRIIDLTPIDECDMFPILFRGNDGFYYQRKKVLIVAINGMPYRMVFKSRAKHIASKKINETFLKACKHNGLKDPIEGVFKIFSTELVGKRGKYYYSMSAGYVRPATDDELIAVAPFRMIDITKVKQKELDGVPF